MMSMEDGKVITKADFARLLSLFALLEISKNFCTQNEINIYSDIEKRESVKNASNMNKS